MKDIDFDELDKAVSSILAPSQEPKKSAPVSTAVKDEPQPVELPDEQKSETSDAVTVTTVSQANKELSENTNTKTTEPVIGAAPVVTPRRSGRFMDMVHPESVKASSSTIVSKSGRTLQPSGESVKSTTVTDIKPLKENKNDGSAVTPSSSAEPVWPDPIDSQEDNNSEDGHPDKVDVDEQLAMKPFKDWDMDGTVETPSATTGVETPFINDAKVEKRPLGAFSESANTSDADTETNGSEENKISVLSQNESTSDEQSETSNDISAVAVSDGDNDDKEVHATRLEVDYPDATPVERDQTPQEEKPVLEKLPPELEQDIVAVESDAEKTNYQKPLMKINEDAKEPKKPGHGNPIMTADSMVSAASAMSIPQQYKEGSEAASSRHSSMFDTKEYHPPITKYGESHNHKHTVVWVMVALMLLIATAAGFGYWLYLQI